MTSKPVKLLPRPKRDNRRVQTSRTGRLVGVRAVVGADIPELVDMAEAMHKESVYRKVVFDRRKVERLIEYCANDRARSLAVVALRDSWIVGALVAYFTEYYFSQETIAQDYVLYVKKSARRRSNAASALIRSYVSWAKGKGVTEATLGITAGINNDEVHMLYEHHGFKKIGAIYKRGDF